MVRSLIKRSIKKKIRESPKAMLFTGVMLLTVLIAFVLNLWQQQWASAFFSGFIFILILLPHVIERLSGLEIPAGIEVLSIIFIYLSLFFGTMSNYYAEYIWWDVLVHLFSGIYLGIIGFLILYILLYAHHFKTSSLIVALFTFCFALAVGALWEIYEFAGDQIFGTKMQGGTISPEPNLIDTMKDIINDAIGSLIAGIMAYFYLKRQKVVLVHTMVKELKKDNPALFKRRRSR